MTRPTGPDPHPADAHNGVDDRAVDHDGQYEEVRSFARRWADGTLRQAKRYRDAETAAERALKAYDRLEDWSPAWSEVLETMEDAWVEGHLLVVAAHQLSNWARRLQVERGNPAPAEDTLLNDLRNALEHLDEAVFVDGEPRRDPAAKSRRKVWSLERLPSPPGTTFAARGTAILGLLPTDAVEQTASALAGEILDEIEAPAIDAYIQSVIDDRLGR